MNDIANSKVANLIKSLQTTNGKRNLKIAIGIVSFLCGFKIIYVVVTKLWFVILLALTHWKLSLFLLFSACVFGFAYSGIILKLVEVII